MGVCFARLRKGSGNFILTSIDVTKTSILSCMYKIMSRENYISQCMYTRAYITVYSSITSPKSSSPWGIRAGHKY